MGLLEQIVLTTRRDVGRRRAEIPLGQLEAQVARGPARRSLELALRQPGLSLIAEHKRRSPSAGPLRPGSSVREVVTAYRRGGASALSILTEQAHFDGSLKDLREARAATDLPILRKDFIVDPYQLYEAAAAGADAVLLIVAALDAPSLLSLHAQARELELDVLVEVHDRAELRAAAQIGAHVIGINNRNLSDFTVDPGRTLTLLGEVPAGSVVISESGLGSRAQLAELLRAGVDAVLVGEALMRAPDPEAACRALSGLGTQAGADLDPLERVPPHSNS